MLELRCVKKFVDRDNNVIGYRLKDNLGNTKDIMEEPLKNAIRNNQVSVMNLVLTIDNKLIEDYINQIPVEILDLAKNIESAKAFLTKFRLLGIGGIQFNENFTTLLKFQNSLNNVTLPRVSTIGKKAFRNNTAVEIVKMPSSVIDIADEAFCLCTSLKQIEISDNIRRLGKASFEGCRALNKIQLPDSIEEIGSRAFEGCSSLQTIVIPDNVKNIGKFTFVRCTSLQNVKISGGIEQIPVYTFSNCKSLKNVIISEGVKKICNSAFICCSSLEIIRIPKSVDEVEDGVFKYCNSLKELILYKRYNNIGYWGIPDDCTIYYV